MFDEYLRDIGRFRLLSKEEEIAIARQIQNDWISFKNATSLTPEESKRRDRGLRARQKMIRHNMRLVVDIAKKYQRLGLPMEDLVNEGVEGLTTAAERFDPGKGVRFSTYAYRWVRQSIKRSAARKGRVITITECMQDDQYHIRQAVAKYSQANGGRSPTISEIAQLMDKTVKWVRQRIEVPHACSLDAKLSTEKNAETLERYVAYDKDVLQEAILQEEIKELRRAIAKLTPRRRQIVELHFGLNDGEPLTLNEIARRLECDISGIRRLWRDALEDLRREMTRTGQVSQDVVRKMLEILMARMAA